MLYDFSALASSWWQYAVGHIASPIEVVGEHDLGDGSLKPRDIVDDAYRFPPIVPPLADVQFVATWQFGRTITAQFSAELASATAGAADAARTIIVR